MSGGGLVSEGGASELSEAVTPPTVGPPPTADLPASVQRRLAGWSADSLSALSADRVPVALRRVSSFAPAKRARAGFGPLLTALDTDPVFRAHVAQFVSSIPGRTVAAPSTPNDPVEAAAHALLLHLPSARQLLAEVAAADAVGALQRQVGELTAELERTSAARLLAEASRNELARQLSAAATPAATGSGDPDKLRGRLREQGTTIRELRDRLEGQAAAAAEELESIRRDFARSRSEVKALGDRLEAARLRGDRAVAQLQTMTAEAAAGQHSADRRVELLLQTLEEGVGGLRHQLRLRQGGTEPADIVANQLPTTVRASLRAADATLLTEWMMLPKAHLIVDGYNISKTGYPAMTLAHQRERLVRELAALAARTSSEITVVFDGAAVVAPQSRVRGVRVIFSPPGVIADEVIRQLVLAEPIGRVLVVATADKEILDSVVANGARTVTPLVLLALLAP